MNTFIDSNSISRMISIESLQNYFKQEFVTRSRLVSDIPERQVITRHNPFSAFSSTPALCTSKALFINKSATWVGSDNNSNSVKSVISAFSSKDGCFICNLDGDYLAYLKCAAIVGLVTGLCTHKPNTLGIIGAGKLAYWQAMGLLSTGCYKSLLIYNRSPQSAYKLTNQLKAFNTGFHNVSFHICSDINELAMYADVICTTTASAEPVLTPETPFKSKVHINCMGAHTPEMREVSHELMGTSNLIVEDIDTAVREAGNVHQSAHEIEDIVQGLKLKQAPGISIFSSTAHGYLDLLTVSHVLETLNTNNAH